jgi:hypothetical protein
VVPPLRKIDDLGRTPREISAWHGGCFVFGSMLNTTKQDNTLQSWLQSVSSELEVRRIETRALPRPKRNREREKARREARQLFAAYYAEQAIHNIAH